MKLPIVAAVAALPFSADAFSASVVTGFKGKAASSFEEDLMLTLQIIHDHDARSTTVSKEQFISQMQEMKEKPAEDIDVSIPYDAPAMLAFESSDKSMSFDDFKAKYLEETVAYIKSKQPSKEAAPAPSKAAAPATLDISIPYDAAAKLAYEASDKSVEYSAFKTKYEEDTVAYIKSKQPIDISIPYDAAAKLAYEASDKSMAYPAFKAKYEEETVSYIKSKQPIDISIPYDAAAKLAYDASDKSMAYPAFKTKYEEETVTYIKSKQPKKDAPAPAAASAKAAAAPATIDISIPYDAAAKLAFEASDKSMSYDDFKAKYDADTVAMVTAKKLAKESS